MTKDEKELTWENFSTMRQRDGDRWKGGTKQTTSLLYRPNHGQSTDWSENYNLYTVPTHAHCERYFLTRRKQFQQPLPPMNKVKSGNCGPFCSVCEPLKTYLSGQHALKYNIYFVQQFKLRIYQKELIFGQLQRASRMRAVPLPVSYQGYTLRLVQSSFPVFSLVVLGFPSCFSYICYPGLSPSHPVVLLDVACSYALIYVLIALSYLYQSAMGITHPPTVGTSLKFDFAHFSLIDNP